MYEHISESWIQYRPVEQFCAAGQYHIHNFTVIFDPQYEYGSAVAKVLTAPSPTMENPKCGTIYLRGVLHQINSSTRTGHAIEIRPNTNEGGVARHTESRHGFNVLTIFSPVHGFQHSCGSEKQKWDTRLNFIISPQNEVFPLEHAHHPNRTQCRGMKCW